MSEPYDEDDVKNAFDTIKKAMQADCPEEHGSYAHSWHCNIAMMCLDAMDNADFTISYLDHDEAYEVAQEAASKFMELCFGVTTTA